MKTFLAMTSIVLTVAAAGAQQGPSWKIEAGGGRGSMSWRVPLEQKVVKGAPYSAEIEIENVQTLADGNRIAHRTTGRVYRDSAGRIRREENRPSGPPTVSIFDPVADVTYSLDVEQRVAWKSRAIVSVSILKMVEEHKRAHAQEEHKRAHAQEEHKGAHVQADAAKVDAAKVRAAGKLAPPKVAAPEAEQREEALAATMMEGVRAEGKRRTSTIPAGQIGNELPIKVVSEEWISPDLQVLIMTHHSDPRVGESSYRVRNINRSEPYASLFQVPADYTIKETGIERLEARKHHQ
ncbi:MAG: hypothetical protein HYZ58_13090 [Acidobacteria bacterium]|nr:hypothetical protein [Acidobacteriota bacterium]